MRNRKYLLKYSYCFPSNRSLLSWVATVVFNVRLLHAVAFSSKTLVATQLYKQIIYYDFEKQYSLLPCTSMYLAIWEQLLPNPSNFWLVFESKVFDSVKLVLSEWSMKPLKNIDILKSDNNQLRFVILFEDLDRSIFYIILPYIHSYYFCIVRPQCRKCFLVQNDFFFKKYSNGKGDLQKHRCKVR